MSKLFNVVLSDGWKVFSSESTAHSGQVLSTDASFSQNGYATSVPATVLGALVENDVYKDPYFGENLKAIPTDQFKVPWWYTTTFSIEEDLSGLYGMLYFDGINYKANVWLNGNLIADSGLIDGAYKRTSVDVTTAIRKGENILAIEVIPPVPGDFSTGFVDWNPAPPDGNMGVFRPVILRLHRGVRVENPFVRSRIDFNDPVSAKLTVSAELSNDADQAIEGVLKGKIGDAVFQQPVTLSPGGSKVKVVFTPEDYDPLILSNPKLWWPYQLGEPHLYDLDMRFEVNGVVSSESRTRFGIREIKDYWLEDTHRGYMVNGVKVLIKGAGWTDDLLLMDSHEKIEAQVRYVKHMNMNCIRLEGFWGTDKKLYDLCDEYGILLMAGWSCHWEHEIHMGIPVNERYGAVYKPDDIEHVAQAWEDQLLWLRNHPSIFVWTVASDKVPITELEQKYIDTFAEYDPDRPYLNSTGGVGSDQHVIGPEDVISEISGSSGVKMLGPYAYTAPGYWYTDTQFGGAYGFNTETGPGAQVPQLESLRKFIPEDQLWPVNEVWDYHCGRYEFSTINRFITAINERYGTPKDITEFDRKAQAMNYELMRPMFEAFQVNKKKATGVIQWMLNGAWPKMYWQLYDYYLNPNGAFYATLKACEPLQLIYNYGNQQVYGVNDYQQPVNGLKAHIRGYDIHSKVIFEEIITFDAEPDSSVSLFQIEKLKDMSTTWFLDLRLYDANEVPISTNFYWLSTKEEILDYEADLGDFAYHTPSKQYADLRQLNELKSTTVAVSYEVSDAKSGREIVVHLENTGNTIAFMINLKLIDQQTNELILPVFWNDNFVSLLPGEKRTLQAGFESDGQPELQVEGWNMKSM
ncbi:hypothetical protein KUV50_10150 [Membranicola marinus]|uniref:Lysosomal beta A mannosidase n=1 Tax=Membranihabitans marinus TaxID=1227546 RepID=A0A953HUE5_9BACT|nr:glycoside hydrolase family 2 TIM barrel-domain containing protein [Membranihabitans marinus]MBY5958495.1 hypothetical protein [Membranihabitans marinus]